MWLSKRSLWVPCLITLLSTNAMGQQNQPKNRSDTQPVAGVATGIVGVTVEEVVIVASGWSVKKQMLGKDVVNDKGEKLGKVDDIIVSNEKSLSYAILGVGGFLGVGKRDVAIPVGQLKIDRDRFILAGASKDSVRAMPEFQYAR